MLQTASLRLLTTPQPLTAHTRGRERWNQLVYIYTALVSGGGGDPIRGKAETIKNLFKVFKLLFIS